MIAWMTKNPVAANLLMLVFLLGGALVGSQVKQEVFPEFDLDLIQIAVPYPGASPEETEQGIVLALEEGVRSIDGVKRVTASAAEGAGALTVELEHGVDSAAVLQDVKSAVDAIRSFPEEAEKPTVQLLARRSQVITFMIYGEADEESLREVGERARDGLLNEPSITYVELSGVREPELSIELNEETLSRYGLSLGEVARKIRSQAIELPGGAIKTPGGEVLMRMSERRDSDLEFAALPILAGPSGAEVKLGDIAKITDGFAETELEARFNGLPAVQIAVFRSGDQTPGDVSRDARAFFESYEPQLPPGVHVAPLDDASEMLQSRMDLLFSNAYVGLILVLLILGLFLNVRLAFWVTMGIPISFLGSLLVLPLVGATINMISLFAFIVTLGIVVDDAIVVGENVFEHQAKGKSMLQAAVKGTQQIGVPVVFSVLTTMVAFSPLFGVPGNTGKFFYSIPIVVITVLAVSLIESLFILPAHLSHESDFERQTFGLFDRNIPKSATDWRSRIIRLLNWPRHSFQSGLDRMRDGIYDRSLQFAARRRYLTVAIAIALLLPTLAYVLSGRMRFYPTPKIDGDTVTASLALPYGAPPKDTRRLQARLLEAAETVLAENGGKEAISRGVLTYYGARMGFGGSARGGGESHLASVRIYLKPSDQRPISAGDFAKAWREALGPVAGVESLNFKSQVGPGAASAISVELTHTNIQLLEEAASELADYLSTYSGVTDVDDGVSTGKPQLSFKIKPAGEALGVTATVLGQEVRSAFYGAEALRQQRGRNEIKVMVRRPLSERSSEDDIESYWVKTPAGPEVPLDEVASIERGHAYTTIKRTDGRRVMAVTADVLPDVGDPEKVMAALAKEVLPKIIAEYPGLDYSFEGNKRSTNEALGALKIGALLALFLIYALIAIPFKSYLQPVVVMSAIPFGLVGAIVGHLLMGYDLSMISVFGFVAVSGIVVNDALVLVHAANAFRKEEGLSPIEAVIQAGKRRLRPILLTSLTTFFGLAPMILETSVQARFLIPMAISLGFGVMFATLITLLLVPALYLVVEDGVEYYRFKDPPKAP